MFKTHYIKYVFNAYAAYFIFALRKKKRGRWLIGGSNGLLYTDNARSFYEYILANHEDKNIFWVASRNSPAWNDIKGQRLVKGSINAYLHFFESEVVLFSDTFNSDIAPLCMVLPLINRSYFNCFKVYLGHGTIAFKKYPKSSNLKKKLSERAFRSYDLAIASTQLEKQVMLTYQIRASCIKLLGSARHDDLKDEASSEDTILVAPTWRYWLKSNKELNGTPFYQHYTELLTNERLLNFLHRSDVKIVFYLHHMFQKHREEFKHCQSDVVKVAQPDISIGHYIRRAKLLVTDYSSVSSDFYYLSKPIQFFHFDLEEYLAKTGSEIDLVNNSFGEISYKTNGLISKIINNVSDEYQISDLQVEGEKYFLNFRDKNNCRRIYDAVMEKL